MSDTAAKSNGFMVWWCKLFMVRDLDIEVLQLGSDRRKRPVSMPVQHYFPALGVLPRCVEAGKVKMLSFSGTFTSTFSTVSLARLGSPFSPVSRANGKYSPLTSS